MSRKTAADFDPELLNLFDGLVHGAISKREFLRDAGRFAAGGVTAAMLLEQLKPNYALAAQVPENDPSLKVERITYPSAEGHGEINGLLAAPADAEPRAAVLVVHENRGLNPYIEDVVRRVAKAGYLALGPDGLTAKGGYPGNDDDGRKLQRELDRSRLLNDFFAGYEFLAARKAGTGRVGAVGFCYGGGVCNALAVRFAQLACAVPFYGRQAAVDDVPSIKAAMLYQFAGNDARVNATWPEVEAALKAAGTTYAAHFYPDTNHGFHNDTTPRFDEAAAALAWERTLAWFETYLTDADPG